MSDSPSVLVSGCSSGIGRCAALGLQRRGWRVFAGARREADVAALAAEGLESLRLDLDDPPSLREAVETVLERTGGELDGLFNNAGFGQLGAVEDLDRDALRAQFETNVFGTVELTNRVLPAMRRRGRGRIVQNSSVLGLVSMPMRGAYNASKHALEALSDTLRLELAGSGIHVALIEPGPITSRFRANARARFRSTIDRGASPHRETYQRLEERLGRSDTSDRWVLPPEAVLRHLVHALESDRPRARYRVTVPAHAMAVARRLLPTRALDALLRAASGV